MFHNYVCLTIVVATVAARPNDDHIKANGYHKKATPLLPTILKGCTTQRLRYLSLSVVGIVLLLPFLLSLSLSIITSCSSSPVSLPAAYTPSATFIFGFALPLSDVFPRVFRTCRTASAKVSAKQSLHTH